jgi:Ribosomal protein S12/S23
VLSAAVLSSAALHAQDEVLIAGFGRRGHAVGDIPGVRFKVRTLSQTSIEFCFGGLLLADLKAAGYVLDYAE